MPRAKKPDAPKFEPVTIAGYRPEVYSLATPEFERTAILAEDGKRIMLQRTTATLERLGVLQKYLGLSGKLGDPADLLMLLISVADKYVSGFEVKVGATPKRGTKKVADRFKTVTEIESVRILQNLPSIAAALDVVAADRRPAIRPQELSAKYYRCLDEITENKQADALLCYWRQTRKRMPPSVGMQEFEPLFWMCERDCLGAVRPHNVTSLRSRVK